ncbi:hypothetical protein [Blastochloris sulfoviridis]|uniref:Uncharacterized protein n=1 Tax=Blastochloris sulfoviridis TaxID=50712 RepID=A0A5M6HQV0_9HYPH|nr:hypothetical protein [Blastochloris sulfoviridis]KAA5598220.1 hypothetical protein F1193_13615 [Blastochloris sulfoviridis]
MTKRAYRESGLWRVPAAPVVALVLQLVMVAPLAAQTFTLPATPTAEGSGASTRAEPATCGDAQTLLASELVAMHRRFEEMAQKLDACTAHEAVNRNSNARLLVDLEACRASVDDRPASPVRTCPTIESLPPRQPPLACEGGAALETANRRIRQLEERFQKLGLTPDEGYAYVGGAYESFVASDQLVARLGNAPRLDGVKCGEALEWLTRQTGKEQPYKLAIWVWQHGQIRVCRRAAPSGATVEAPGFDEEAHALVLR